LLKNKNINTYYIIHLIYFQNFSNNELDLIIQLGNIYDNFELNFMKIKNIFNNLPVSKNLPQTTYIRLIFSSLFKNYSKIIYLDGDTIILKDLSNMYNINIDKYYFVGQFHNGAKDEKYLKFSKHYINAGVLLINLYQQRKDKAEIKILKWAEKNKKYLTFKDQTIINYCFIDKVGILPPEYGILANPFNFYIKRTKNFTLGIFNRSQYEKAYNDPIIVHFHGSNKPWIKNAKKRYQMKQWWKYAKFSGIYNVLLNNYKKYIFFGIIKYNNKYNNNLEKYLLYFGQIKLLSIYKYIQYINNEQIDIYKGKKIKVIINKIINNKIPSKQIIPLFISFEINKNEYNKNIIKYLKKFEPIGCNDYYTLNYLVKKKINSYYSGSYLILLGYKYKKKKKKKHNFFRF
jgi:lipopolysaccharide biosynthesis glycosyltransferase